MTRCSHSPIATLVQAARGRFCCLTPIPVVADDGGPNVSTGRRYSPSSAGGHMRGLRFTETMRGFCSTKVTDDYARAAEQGQRDHSLLDFTLTIATGDLGGFLESPAHETPITGQVVAPALSATPM